MNEPMGRLGKPANLGGILNRGNVLTPGYIVDRHLSRGAVLDVYSVHSAQRDCLCVAKLLRSDRTASDHDRRQLIREGRLLVELSHPHLVRGYELINADTGGMGCGVGPVVIMETLTGATLSHVILSKGRLGLDDTALLGLHLASVLHYLHGAGIVHLDLKPSNIVCDAGIARVLDLSLAQPMGKCRPSAGTHEYMAPEQVVGGRVGPATDVWGLGGVLYRALTGQRPFPRMDGPRDPKQDLDLEPLRRSGIHPEMFEAVASCFEPQMIMRPEIDDIRNTLTRVLKDEESADSYGADVLSFVERRPA